MLTIIAKKNEVFTLAEIEVRAFGKLFLLFKERGWANPKTVTITGSLTAETLREKLEIPPEDVEAVFINHLIRPFSTPLEANDRLAFVPPGIPSIHRFNLGFYSVKKQSPGE